MLEIRKIPILTFIGEDLVKTIQFKNPRYIGDPLNVVRIFNEKQVDELIIIDIRASQNNHTPNYRLIENLSAECNMPITYGGGISNFEQASKIFDLGVEKILIRTKKDDLVLLNQIAKKFGNQSLIIGFDLTSNSEIHGIVETIKTLYEVGIGEIFINHIERDGTMLGVNLDYIKIFASTLNLPLIWAGGFKSVSDIADAAKVGLSAAGIGSLYFFYGRYQSVLVTYK